MQSVIVILALILLFIFIYGYASYSIEHHKDTKKLYIPLNDKDDKNIESFTVGGENEDTCSSEAKAGDSNYCYNGGTCISVSGTSLDRTGDLVQITNGNNQQAYPTVEYDPVNKKIMIAWMSQAETTSPERGLIS